MLNWNPDKTTVGREVFRKRLYEAMSGESWIIDGNYASTIEIRLKACDTVFFLDYSAEVCLNGIMRRRGKPRPDMPWIEPEDETDDEFIEFVKSFEENVKPEIMKLLKTYSNKKITVFHERSEADEYLKNLAAPPRSADV